jgi:OOP family OmpA-OmpF porin
MGINNYVNNKLNMKHETKGNIKMKNKFLALSVLTILSQAAYADDAYENQTWFGGFGEYYNSDNEKFLPGPQYTDGFGAGLEFGTRFSASWAGRVEWSHTNLDTSDTNESINGDRVGIDVLFYPEQSDYYLFTGLKIERYDDTQSLFNVGLGRHWEVKPNFKIITEIAAYHDFGEAYLDHSIKLGIAYSFGGTAAPAQVVETFLDSDNDSVEDSRDLCPNTPLNSRVDSNGCVVKPVVADNDNDGVSNKTDMCANTPSTDKVDSKGCSIFEGKEVDMHLDIKFANNSSLVKTTDMSELADFAAFLKRFPDTNAVIEGHSSSVGDKQYNLHLSQKRAESVRNILVKQYGVKASRLDVKGYGASQLLDNSDTLKAHKANRRIVANVTAIEQKKVTK